jgi:hypothetical protein
MLDDVAWTEIDRQTDYEHFKEAWDIASFAVANSAECRFIRLTQTSKDHNGDDCLGIYALDFFGTLLE